MLERLFKYTSLATLNNVFMEFQKIHELLNTVFKTLFIKALQNKFENNIVIHSM